LESGLSLIIPTGSLSEQFENKPDANIFVSEQAYWLSPGLTAKKLSHYLI